MNEHQRKTEIFNVVWRACDTFRGVIDPAMYKDYILTMLFVKYLSDIRKYKLAEKKRNLMTGICLRVTLKHDRNKVEHERSTKKN